MKYMTFNSSCSYAGVANMLESYAMDVEDRQIALDMGLPFLFSFENGSYCSGPMLQTAEWFNLYLHPRGFHMSETVLPQTEVPAFLADTSSAMLGIASPTGGKHAVVYKGKENGYWIFLNNKPKASTAPETICFSDDELLQGLDHQVVIATLQKIAPLKVDLKSRFRDSARVLLQLKQDITAFCSIEQQPQALKKAQDTLFRAILLDGITMLELLENTDPVRTLKSIRKVFLSALKENRSLVLADRISMAGFEHAIDTYIELIQIHAG